MASVTTRPIEPNSSNFDAVALPINRPSQMPSHRTTTPRPSISPLSSASKTQQSPIGARNAIVSEESPTKGGNRHHTSRTEYNVDDTLDDHSSSLSEPDDDLDEDELPFNVGQVRPSAAALTIELMQDADSEAETERLDLTPQKYRHRTFAPGKTPTKLRHALGTTNDFSEPPSPSLPHAQEDAQSETGSFLGRKRKRSDSVESPLSSAASDVDDSPRKRFLESPDELLGEHTGDRLTSSGYKDLLAEQLRDEEHDAKIDDPADVSGAHTMKSRKGKVKGRRAERNGSAIAATEIDDTIDGDANLDTESTVRSEEERVHRNDASLLFEDLAKQFTSFKEKLYNERLESLTAELDMLAQSDCYHPEYLRQVSTIDARREKQLRESHAFFRYRTLCIKQRTLAERSQMQSQYFQNVREIRERTMDKLGEDWYNIQTERRQTHQEKDMAYVYRFPTQKAAQIRQQAKYNQEISILSGVARYVGFPAAPDIQGAQGEPLEADLKAMKISRRANANIAHSRPVIFSRNASSAMAQSERLAHEQYLEQNAWARPQAPTQQHGTPNLTHTPDWADLPGQPRSAPRRSALSDQANLDTHATYTPSKNALPDVVHSGLLPLHNDGAGNGSVTQPRAHLASSNKELADGTESAGLSSPVMGAKPRQTPGEVSNFRNFSNVSRVSGASTIDAPSECEREREPLQFASTPAYQGLTTFQPLNGNSQRQVSDANHDALTVPGFRSHHTGPSSPQRSVPDVGS